MRISIVIFLLFSLPACAMPIAKQNPNFSGKRPVKTSKFLASNDYYAPASLKKVKTYELKSSAKVDAKPEVKSEVKPEQKIAELPTKQVEEAVVKAPELEVKKAEEAAEQISDFPKGKDYNRTMKGFGGFAKSGFTEEVEESTEEASKPEIPLFEQEGLASWYGPGFHGRKTANGEKFNQNAMTAAHRKLPLGSVVEVTNVETGKTITVRINDRGPYIGKRIIDLSKAAAAELDIIDSGVGTVRVKQVQK